MVDSKQDAIERIRSYGEEKIKRIAKYSEEPYRATAITILEISGEVIYAR
jgi:hypothetical protein